MNSPIQFSSPLKKMSACSQYYLRHASDEPHNPFREIVDSQDTKRTLSEMYRFNLDISEIVSNKKEFSEVREIVEAIEGIISKFCNQDEQDDLRSQVTRILGIQEHKKKLSELGLALFYLDRERDIPLTPSLVSFRADEMNKEVYVYIKQHQSTGVSSLIPTGKSQYLMRAFFHMVLTSTQIYNRGGLFAIQEFLRIPSLGIADHFQPEHLHHLLGVTDRLLNNSDFKALIESTVSIHPDLEALIRLDLKLPPEDPIKSGHIIYDIIMSMFIDIRQNRSPNCYAIAALIYIIENYPCEYFQMTIRWLKEGTISLGQDCALPIKSLIENRHINLKELGECVVPIKDITCLAPFQHLSGTFGIDLSAFSSSEASEPLSKILFELFKKNIAPEHVSYAINMYSAYKINTLIPLHLSIFEITFMNNSKIILPNFPLVSFYKKKLIETCLSSVNSTSKTRIQPEYLSKFTELLIKTFWLQNRNEQVVHIAGNTVFLQGRAITPFSGSLTQLASVFRKSSRLYALIENSYEKIDTISRFQDLLVKVASDALKEMPSDVKSVYASSKDLISSIFKSEAFKEHIAKYCSDQMKEKKIKGIHLSEANLLLFKQFGGNAEDVLKLVYDIKVMKVKIENNENAKQFMKNLLMKMPEMNTDMFNTANKVILFAVGYHFWTLTPYSWRYLMQNRRKFDDYIQDEVFFKVKKKLERPISQKIIDKVIDRYTVDFTTRDALKAEFQESSSLTFKKFADDFCKSIYVGDELKSQSLLSQAFEEIWISKDSLRSVLRRLRVRITRRQFNTLFDSLPLNGVKLYVLARELREKLIRQGIYIKYPYDVEHALCQIHKEPLNFPLGDSNWQQTNTEDPYHVKLCIGYDYTSKELVYKSRFKEVEEKYNPKIFKTVEIQYPLTIDSDTIVAMNLFEKIFKH